MTNRSVAEFTIPMPILRPVQIPTKGLPWGKRFLKHFESRRWELVEDYNLYLPWLDITLVIPKGFIFDGASVPRVLWPIMSPTGILFIGSIFHDFGYKYNGFLDKNLKIVYNECGRKFVDDLFCDINVYVNDIHAMNQVAWFFLRSFGWMAWNNHRKSNNYIINDYQQIVQRELLRKQ